MKALFAFLALFLALSIVKGDAHSASRAERPLRSPTSECRPGPGYTGPGAINFGNYRGGPQPINVGPGSNYANVQEPANSLTNGGRQPGMYPGGVDYTGYAWGRRR